MAKYTYIFRGGAFVVPGLSPSEMQTHLNKWHAWLAVLVKEGRHQGGQPLENGGKVLRGKGRAVVTDGPYAESKDLVTGSIVIEAASLDEAVEIARGCPIYEYDGTLEVRQVLELEH